MAGMALSRISPRVEWWFGGAPREIPPAAELRRRSG